DDSGYNWSGCWNGSPGMIGGDITPGDITIDPFNDQHLVVVCYVWPVEYNEYRWIESFDGGVNWAPRILDFPSPAPSKIAFDPTQEGVIYLGTEEQGLFKSIDNGESWVNISFDICRGRPVLFVKVDSTGTVYTSIEPVGFYRSSDGGESWEHLTESFPGGGVNFFLDRQPESDRTLASQVSHLSIFQDDEWNRIDQTLPIEAGLEVRGLFDPINPDRIYAATDYYNYGTPNLWYTDDAGVNWTAVESQPDTIDNIFYLDKIFSGDPRLIVKVSYGGLWIYETDSGLWEDITPPGASFSYFDQPRASSLIQGLVYYGGNGFAYRSDNCGEDWISLPLPNISQHNWKLFPDPISPDMVWASRIDAYPLLRSFDRGENWEVCFSLYFSSPGNCVTSICRLMDYPDVTVAGVWNPYSTFISYDSGDNWEAFAEGLNYQTTFYHMICEPDEGGIIWAATSDGVKKLDWNDVAVEIRDIASVYDNKLHSPHPNPFNPATVISFELKDAGEVSLIVYDVQGREVQSLVTGHLSLGYHEVVFDGTNLSSGMYFVRLAVDGGQPAVRKVVLMK
ncbi:T9SS type A sorting domain-containing protein, partial [bacterium]|nr:T9SS type A sorting domain-containing protein [bacterium]